MRHCSSSIARGLNFLTAGSLIRSSFAVACFDFQKPKGFVGCCHCCLLQRIPSTISEAPHTRTSPKQLPNNIDILAYMSSAAAWVCRNRSFQKASNSFGSTMFSCMRRRHASMMNDIIAFPFEQGTSSTHAWTSKATTPSKVRSSDLWQQPSRRQLQSQLNVKPLGSSIDPHCKPSCSFSFNARGSLWSSLKSTARSRGLSPNRFLSYRN